jgi:hypothetical protein
MTPKTDPLVVEAMTALTKLPHVRERREDENVALYYQHVVVLVDDADRLLAHLKVTGRRFPLIGPTARPATDIEIELHSKYARRQVWTSVGRKHPTTPTATKWLRDTMPAIAKRLANVRTRALACRAEQEVAQAAQNTLYTQVVEALADRAHVDAHDSTTVRVGATRLDAPLTLRVGATEIHASWPLPRTLKLEQLPRVATAIVELEKALRG